MKQIANVQSSLDNKYKSLNDKRNKQIYNNHNYKFAQLLLLNFHVEDTIYKWQFQKTESKIKLTTYLQHSLYLFSTFL